MNMEQAREVFHEACGSLFAMMNNYRCRTQLYARLWKCLSSYSELIYLCVWILFMWCQKLEVSCRMVSRFERTFVE
jgi:hypothetical protein